MWVRSWINILIRSNCSFVSSRWTLCPNLGWCFVMSVNRLWVAILIRPEGRKRQGGGGGGGGVVLKKGRKRKEKRSERKKMSCVYFFFLQINLRRKLHWQIEFFFYTKCICVHLIHVKKVLSMSFVYKMKKKRIISLLRFGWSSTEGKSWLLDWLMNWLVGCVFDW